MMGSDYGVAGKRNRDGVDTNVYGKRLSNFFGQRDYSGQR